MPTDQSYNYENTALKKGKSKLKAITAANVDYSVAGRLTLAAKDYLTQINYYGAVHYDDASKLTAKLNAMDKEVRLGQELQVQDANRVNHHRYQPELRLGSGQPTPEGGSVSL